MKLRRIAVTGTHCTGKTTLITALAAQFQDGFSFTPEVARDLLARGVPMNDGVTVDAYLQYVTEQLFRHRTTNGTLVISDRTLLDLLAYILASGTPSVPSEYISMLRELVLLEARLFSIYIYLPIEFGLVADDVRPHDEQFRLSVDCTIRQLLAEFGLPYVVVTGDLSERLRAVTRLLEGSG